MASVLEIIVGDILEVPADVVAFKHAAQFYGADGEALERLRKVGYHSEDLEADDGQYRQVESRGALGAAQAIFVGVGPLIDLNYKKIRSFSKRVVEISTSDLRARHLAMTTHGPGAGLDEQEAFLSQVAGLLEAFEALGDSGGLELITIVERNAKRADLLARTLRDHLAEIPSARLETDDPGARTFGIDATARPQRRGGWATVGNAIPLLERMPEREPHVFIAYPFSLEDHARYGVEGPAKRAGYLARLIADDVYTGEILQRIKNQIESAELVVAVLTQANPNVFLEVGYAWGKGKPTVLVADENETLKFDVSGQRIVLYTNITDLERKFEKELEGLRATGVLQSS